MKPIIGSSSGDGVKIVNIDDCTSKEVEQSLERIFEVYKQNFIIQEKLNQHDIVSTIYKDSVNTFRIITYIINNKLYHMPIVLRVGTNGQKVDNIHAGGIAIGISEDGILNDVGYDNENKEYRQHPNTNVIFKNYSIPFIPEVIKAAYKAHQNTPHLGVISWDFMINENSQIILIEANLIGQSIWFPQIVNGIGAFKENTKEVLRYLSKK